MSTTFRLVWPLSDLHNSNHRGHWTVASGKRKRMRTAARMVCADVTPITGPARLTVTFQFPDRRERDLDNIEIKGAIDGAVDAGVIENDRREVLRSVTRENSDTRSPKGYVVLAFEFVEVAL